jgi:hypothetical protein
MNQLTFYYLGGQSLVPALIAFAATFILKKDAARPPVCWQRRLVSAAVIYAVCLGIELVTSITLTAAAIPNPLAYESPVLIVAGLIAFSLGYRVAFGHFWHGAPPRK